MFNILHLSDWHQRGSDFDRGVVRDALVRDIRRRSEVAESLSTIDLVVFTGDLAFSGKPAEYELAVREFLDPVMTAVDLQRSDCIVIPGNHDLDRGSLDLLPSELQRPFRSLGEANQWFFEKKRLDRVLSPFEAFHEMVSSTGVMGSIHGKSVVFPGSGREVVVRMANSAIMCARNKDPQGEIDDYGHLVVGEDQVYDSELADSSARLRVVVMHHPWPWLAEFDRDRIVGRLTKDFDLLLCGHQHTPDVELVETSTGRLVIVPAGASYDRREAVRPRAINGYNYVQIDLVSLECEVFFRRWNDRKGIWQADQDTSEGGSVKFHLREGSLSQSKEGVSRPSSSSRQRLMYVSRTIARSLAGDRTSSLDDSFERYAASVMRWLSALGTVATSNLEDKEVPLETALHVKVRLSVDEISEGTMVLKGQLGSKALFLACSLEGFIDYDADERRIQITSTNYWFLKGQAEFSFEGHIIIHSVDETGHCVYGTPMYLALTNQV
jgi:3',5'-cyclic AMP phosphodiesterase CpdA